MTGFGFGGFEGMMFTIVPILVIMGFILVFGLIIFSVIRGAREWSRNNRSPVLTVEAKVVAKRTNVSRHTHRRGTDTAMHHSGSSTAYYATFEVESGDRIELHVPDREYGMLVEGDLGRLTFQGTRYHGFERIR